MTTLNAAPTAASTAPTGTAGAAAVPTRAYSAVSSGQLPTATRHEPDKAHGTRIPELHVMGAGSSAASGPTGVMDRSSTVTVPLDQFAKQSGPDVAVQTASGVVSVHAVFQLDAQTRELSVAIVNADGQLIRMIPPKSVARMIAAMAAYRGR